jgi:ABC-type transport system involved in multi-copper enzyme maturation permease subunit
MMATFIIARLTLIEAVRRRILLAAFVLGIAFLILYGIGFYAMLGEVTRAPSSPIMNLQRGGFFSFLAMAGLYAVNFLAIALGALMSADTLAGEIGSGTIQVLATKPVRRVEIVLGKWLGFAILLALYLLLMSGGVLAIAFALGGHIVPNAVAGIALMYLTALLMMSVTLACSSALSTLATGGVVFGLYGIAFIGGWVEQFGAFLQNQGAVNIGIISSLIIPCEALWRRASFEMMPAYAQTSFFISPFASTSVPSEMMIAYGVAYLAVALVFATRRFARRDL